MIDTATRPIHAYVVIPTFNRREITLACLDMLAAQRTQARIIPIVADGGSTDGTQAAVRERYPQAVVLSPPDGEEWFWTGSTDAGLRWALAQPGRTDDDVCILLNNDLRFEPDLVEALVTGLDRYGLDVAIALTYDADDPDRLVGCGVWVEVEGWRGIVDSVRPAEDHAVAANHAVLVNTTTGRGAAVRVSTLLRYGGVDASRFPHYLGDYEFGLRLYRQGAVLAVIPEARVWAYMAMTAERPGDRPLSGVRHWWRMVTDVRSPVNLPVRLRFVQRHATCWLHLVGAAFLEIARAVALLRLIRPGRASARRPASRSGRAARLRDASSPAQSTVGVSWSRRPPVTRGSASDEVEP